MTNLEVSKNLIGTNYPFEDSVYSSGLLHAGVDPEAEYEAGMEFDLALASSILFLITAADIKEGGYSVTLDRNAMLKVRQSLLDRWDIVRPDTGPYLRNKSKLW